MKKSKKLLLKKCVYFIVNQKSQQKKMQIMWKNKNLILTDDQLKFYGNDSLPSELLDMNSTYKCF